jgi:FixJ family two-component response regulator
MRHPPNTQIALVEDDDSLRRAVSNLLASHGLSVTAYASAERFLEQAASETVGCLLLDLRLTAMSGLELLHRLHREGRTIPTVVMTARADEYTREACLAAGAFAFLTKPCPMQVLFQVIDRALAV